MGGRRREKEEGGDARILGLAQTDICATPLLPRGQEIGPRNFFPFQMMPSPLFVTSRPSGGPRSCCCRRCRSQTQSTAFCHGGNNLRVGGGGGGGGGGGRRSRRRSRRSSRSSRRGITNRPVTIYSLVYYERARQTSKATRGFPTCDLEGRIGRSILPRGSFS